MRVDIFSGDGRVQCSLHVRYPSLPDFLAADREGVRRGLANSFGELFRKAPERMTVQFEDECRECGKPMEEGRCRDAACKCGFPPTDVLRRLMKDFPHTPDEGAAVYLDRLRTIWRTGGAPHLPAHQQPGKDPEDVVDHLDEPVSVVKPDNAEEIARHRKDVFAKQGKSHWWWDYYGTLTLYDLMAAVWRDNPPDAVNQVAVDKLVRALRRRGV